MTVSSTAAMKIGDLVLYPGSALLLRGLDPMSVPNRQAFIEDTVTGKERTAPIGGSTRGPPDGSLRRAAGFDRVPSAMTERGDDRLMHEIVIYGVSFDLVGKQPIGAADRRREQVPPDLDRPPQGCGDPDEAAGTAPRPMTHDLVTNARPARRAGRPHHGDRAEGEHLLREHHRPADGSRSRSTRVPRTRSLSPCGGGADLRGRRGDRGVGDRVRGRGRGRRRSSRSSSSSSRASPRTSSPRLRREEELAAL